MTQHFTLNTVSAEFWCGKCRKMTQHSISGRRKGPCMECQARLEEEYRRKAAEPKPPEQGGLFG